MKKRGLDDSQNSSKEFYVNIDTEEDWKEAERILNKNKKSIIG